MKVYCRKDTIADLRVDIKKEKQLEDSKKKQKNIKKAKENIETPNHY